MLTSKVRAALILSPVVNSANIGVETRQGVVLLSGMAADPTQMDLAVFVAQTVPGVASVDRFMFPRDAATVVMGSKNPVELPSAGSGRLKSAVSPDAHLAIAGGPPAAVESPPVSLSHPLPAEAEPFRYSPPTPSRWVTFAHSVQGIRSIQDELLIKR